MKRAELHIDSLAEAAKNQFFYFYAWICLAIVSAMFLIQMGVRVLLLILRARSLPQDEEPRESL